MQIPKRWEASQLHCTLQTSADKKQETEDLNKPTLPGQKDTVPQNAVFLSYPELTTKQMEHSDAWKPVGQRRISKGENQWKESTPVWEHDPQGVTNTLGLNKGLLMFRASYQVLHREKQQLRPGRLTSPGPLLWTAMPRHLPVLAAFSPALAGLFLTLFSLHPSPLRHVYPGSRLSTRRGLKTEYKPNWLAKPACPT